MHKPCHEQKEIEIFNAYLNKCSFAPLFQPIIHEWKQFLPEYHTQMNVYVYITLCQSIFEVIELDNFRKAQKSPSVFSNVNIVFDDVMRIVQWWRGSVLT